MSCKIYKITNKINNKIYIGQTWNSLKERFSDHKKPSSTNCIKLNRAIKKYGVFNFYIELLEECYSQNDADALEKEYIQKYNCITCGYNIKEGGSYGKHSEESKRKIGAAHKGKIISKETRDKISAAISGPNHHHYGKPTWNKGIPPSEDTKDKLSKVHRKLTDEQIESIRNDNRTLNEIAIDYDVGISTIYRIKHNKLRYCKKLFEKK